MPVIAVTQEMGAHGKDVCMSVAKELDLTMVRDEMISDQVAGKLKKRKSAIRRFAEGHASFRERLGTSSRSLAVYSAEEVLEHAANDNVLIRGWGATYLLSEIPYVLRVRICAPVEKRIQWLMERLETDDREFVEDEIHHSDSARASNTQHWFKKTWGDPLDYDLVLNTERLSIETCVEQIKAMLERPEFAKTEAARQKLLNLTLEAHIRAALRAHETTREVQIIIEANSGVVTLMGVVVDEREMSACVEVISNHKDVKEVNNQLNAITAVKVFK